MEQQPETKVRKILFNEISFIVAIIGVVIGVFIFLTNPNNENETALKLQDARITEQRKTIDELTVLQQNEMKEIKNELQGMRVNIEDLIVLTTKLETIINERIPYKK